MIDIVFASGNPGKIREVKEFFRGDRFNVLSPSDIGVNINVAEDGITFEENASKKAQEICDACGLVTLADDSGLVIDALDGAPGVDSANFMGTDTPYSIRNAKILELLTEVPANERTARFVCVIALAVPGWEITTVRGECNGVITQEVAGLDGFGYDPIFLVPKYGITTAQISISQKNEISHRGQALRLVRDLLTAL